MTKEVFRTLGPTSMSENVIAQLRKMGGKVGSNRAVSVGLNIINYAFQGTPWVFNHLIKRGK